MGSMQFDKAVMKLKLVMVAAFSMLFYSVCLLDLALGSYATPLQIVFF